MIQEHDILEDIHRQKSIAITKGYVTSSLVLLLDEGSWYEIKKHPDYTDCVSGDQILGMDWLLIVDIMTTDYYAEVMVKIGAANHVERVDLSHEEPRE